MKNSGRARFAIVGIALLAASAAAGQSGRRDAVFSEVSFDQWRAEGNQTLLHSSFEIVPPELSPFQRIVAGVKVELESPELFEHHARILVQFEDADGGAWQTHGAPGHDPEFVQNAFVLPGDYSVSVAIFDPVTLRHGFMEKKLHVPPLKAEPLPGAWDGLPRVEFLPPDPALPDSWFLPSLTGRLNLPVETQRRVHIDVLVNTTPSDSLHDSVSELRRNMSVVIPSLKVFSQIALSNGTMDVSLVDLVNRRIAPAPNWDDMKARLIQANPAIVDVHALDARAKMRGFMLDEIEKRIAGEAPRVVIVLSGPAFLQNQEPVARLDLPPDPNRRVFYIRCRLIPRSVLAPRPRPRPGARPHPPLPGFFRLPLDDLEEPLDSSGAMLFDVITPEQFRRVLASVIGQISRL